MEKWVYALLSVQFTSVHWLSHVRVFVTPWPAAHQASLSITKSLSLLKLKSIESVMPSNHLILCRPLLSLPSIFPSIRVFSNESVLCIRWPKYLEFQLQHHSFQWIFRTDFLYNWLVLSPFSPRDSQESSPTPQFKSINSSALSPLYSPTLTSIHGCWKNNIAWTIWTFVGRVMSLTLSRLVIGFLPKSKHLLISWLQLLSTVILEPPKIVCHCFHCFPIYLPWSDGTRCHDLSFLNVEL